VGLYESVVIAYSSLFDHLALIGTETRTFWRLFATIYRNQIRPKTASADNQKA